MHDAGFLREEHSPATPQDCVEFYLAGYPVRAPCYLLYPASCILHHILHDLMFKIDLHVHSRFSMDNNSDPEETIVRAIERGLDGIAFTEHYYYDASQPLELLREKYGNSILILRGVEFSAQEGHCLVFGADTDRMNMKYAPVAELIRRVAEDGGAVIPSHPFRPGTSLGDLLFSVKGIAGLEGCNGGNMHAYNVKAIEAAARLNLPFTGGSDAHAPEEVGSCYTEFAEAVTVDNFVALLKAGNYRGVDTRKISRAILR